MAPNTINRKAVELLNNGKITARVGHLQEALQERSDISKDEAVKELTAIIRTRVTDVLNVKGSKVVIKKLDEMPDDVISSISSIKNTRGNIEVRLYDKISAIDRLCKLLGWDEPSKMDIKGSIDTSDLEKMSNEELEAFIEGKIDIMGYDK
jgi:phage terminase small subunit